MKRLILAALATGSFAAANAQVGMAHSVLLYGTGGYGSQHGSETLSFGGASTKTDEPRNINYNISPGIGFQLTDNFAIGIQIGYMGSKYDLDKTQAGTSQPYESKMRDLAVGPFLRYTHPVGEHFFVYGQFTASYLNGRSTDYYQTSPTGGSRTEEDRNNGANFDLYPAFGIRITHSCALSFGFGGLSYQFRKYDFDVTGAPAGTEYTGKSNNFNVSFGQQFNVGIQKYFGGGHHHMGGHHEPMDDTRHMDTKDDDDDSSSKKKKSRKDDDE